MYFLFILGCVFILYFCVIASHTHLNSKFPVIWLILGIIMLISGSLYKKLVTIWEQQAFLWRSIIQFFFVVGVVLILFFLYKILIQFYLKVPPNLPYIIVLGAQMKEKGPSLSLKRRLDRAIVYLRENEDTMVIVSGGKGYNEPVSEAEGMRLYLENQGISGDRIYKEDQSVNTHQNLLYSKKIIEKLEGLKKLERLEKLEKSKKPENNQVGIVTSNFHVYRAKKIALKAGYRRVYGIPSRTERFMLPSAITREVLAIFKDYLLGHLS